MTAAVIIRMLGIALCLALAFAPRAHAANERTLFLRSWYPDNTKTGNADKFISLSVQSTSTNDGLILSAVAYDKSSPVTKIAIAKGSGAILASCAVTATTSPPSVLLDDKGGALLDDAGGLLLAQATESAAPCQATWPMPVSKPAISWYNDVVVTATNAAGKSFTLPTKVVRPYGLPY
jgi:hypothetical protein